jgi:hypothetical protein
MNYLTRNYTYSKNFKSIKCHIETESSIRLFKYTDINFFINNSCLLLSAEQPTHLTSKTHLDISKNDLHWRGKLMLVEFKVWIIHLCIVV